MPEGVGTLSAWVSRYEIPTAHESRGPARPRARARALYLGIDVLDDLRGNIEKEALIVLVIIVENIAVEPRRAVPERRLEAGLVAGQALLVVVHLQLRHETIGGIQVHVARTRRRPAAALVAAIDAGVQQVVLIDFVIEFHLAHGHAVGLLGVGVTRRRGVGRAERIASGRRVGIGRSAHIAAVVVQVLLLIDGVARADDADPVIAETVLQLAERGGRTRPQIQVRISIAVGERHGRNIIGQTGVFEIRGLVVEVVAPAIQRKPSCLPLIRNSWENCW